MENNNSRKWLTLAAQYSLSASQNHFSKCVTLSLIMHKVNNMGIMVFTAPLEKGASHANWKLHPDDWHVVEESCCMFSISRFTLSSHQVYYPWAPQYVSEILYGPEWGKKKVCVCVCWWNTVWMSSESSACVYTSNHLLPLAKLNYFWQGFGRNPVWRVITLHMLSQIKSS